VGLCIAIIDDSAIALSWARAHLEKHGFRVETYSSPFGGQQFVERVNPDALLLDVRMPGLRGDTLCKLLKARARTRNVAVALFSSLPAAELEARVKACGADGFIEKTRNAQELISRVQALVEGNRTGP
jgi:DNA-binding response OmpR family regulator